MKQNDLPIDIKEMSDEEQYYYQTPDGQLEGPIDVQTIVNDVKAGFISKDTMFSRGGDDPWVDYSVVDIRRMKAANPKSLEQNKSSVQSVAKSTWEKLELGAPSNEPYIETSQKSSTNSQECEVTQVLETIVYSNEDPVVTRSMLSIIGWTTIVSGIIAMFSVMPNLTHALIIAFSCLATGFFLIALGEILRLLFLILEQAKKACEKK